MAHLEFHTLTVTEVSPLTDEAVAITLDVPPHLAGTFSYLPGQHVVVRAVVEGRDLRRSYSICANADSGKLRIGVKRLPGGHFSTFATTRLRAGDTLDVMPPLGSFVIEPGTTGPRHRCAIAAGSGITPVLSLVSTTLEREPEARWTVILGNRRAGTVMFLDELEGLKDRHGERLHLIHVLSREETVPLLSGRIDDQRLRDLFSTLVDFRTVDEWYLCGPEGMVAAARHFVEARGVDPNLVRDELFFSAAPAERVEEADTTGSVALEVVLEGRRSSLRMDRKQTILEAALMVRGELPFSCRGGMCATCKARVVEGSVTMDRNHALTAAELAAGFTLTCQARPDEDRIVVDYDQR